MSNKAILQERADALEKELKGLRGEISAMPDDKWVPKRGEMWYSPVLDNGDWEDGAAGYIFRDGDSFYRARQSVGLVFPTKEKAEQARDVIKGMCWEEFPEKGARVWYLVGDEWKFWGLWGGYTYDQAMFRMGTLRVKK